MKLRNLFLLAGLALAATSSYASINDCGKNAIHCAYINGLTDRTYGRVVKITYKNESILGCASSLTTLEITPEHAQAFKGSNSLIFDICNDGAGRNCELLGVDNFTMSQVGDKYIATPQFYNIDLSAVQAKYVKCKLNYTNKIFLP